MPSHHPLSNPTQFRLSWLWKEAAPLPLSFVVFLETQILRDQGTAADRLLMGCLLVLVWSSLRWSDATWVSPSSLSIEDDTIRGVANKTKTTMRGMPFAFLTCGFLSGTTSVSWTKKWLNLVRAALQRTSEAFPGFVPDFCSLCVAQTLITQCWWLQCLGTCHTALVLFVLCVFFFVFCVLLVFGAWFLFVFLFRFCVGYFATERRAMYRSFTSSFHAASPTKTAC